MRIRIKASSIWSSGDPSARHQLKCKSMTCTCAFRFKIQGLKETRLGHGAPWLRLVHGNENSSSSAGALELGASQPTTSFTMPNQHLSRLWPWSSLTQTFLFLHGEVAPSICIAPPGYFTLGSGFTAPARNRQARVHPGCYPARPGLSTHIACHAMIQGDKGCNNACRYIRMQI